MLIALPTCACGLVHGEHDPAEQDTRQLDRTGVEQVSQAKEASRDEPDDLAARRLLLDLLEDAVAAALDAHFDEPETRLAGARQTVRLHRLLVRQTVPRQIELLLDHAVADAHHVLAVDEEVVVVEEN